MSKTNEQILSKVPNLTFSEIENCDLYTESQALIAMTAAREDEREKIRLLITNEIFFLSDKPDSKDRWAINRLNKLLNDLSCT